MTEPVAYLVNGVAFNDIDRAKVYSDVLKYHKKIAVESLVPIPIYTAEQLHPMKWFVRSKEPEDEDEYYLFLSGSDLDDLEYFGFDYARAFDTKEEAELWTNPLTEAVQLAVE